MGFSILKMMNETLHQRKIHAPWQYPMMEIKLCTSSSESSYFCKLSSFELRISDMRFPKGCIFWLLCTSILERWMSFALYQTPREFAEIATRGKQWTFQGREKLQVTRQQVSTLFQLIIISENVQKSYCDTCHTYFYLT